MEIKKNVSYKNKNQSPIKLQLDIMTLDVLCKYALQPDTMVRMEHLVNLNNMISSLDPTTYQNDPEKLRRIQFISKAIDARLNQGITDRELILTYINGGLTFNVDFLDYNNLNLNKNEVNCINDIVTETLEYQFMYQKVDNIIDVCTRFKSSDFNNRGNIISEFEGLIDELKSDFRHSKVDNNSIDMQFSLKNGTFENAITNTYNMITNPSRRLVTGMQGLNEMLGGGFESGRVYMLIGGSGVGKSITLLNLMYQMKQHNVRYKTKDPTKTPCIVMLTMENTVVETITRLFDLVIDHSQGMENYSVQEVIDLLRTQGQLVVNDSSPIDLVIKYKANKSVSTAYLYSLYDDLYDEGYEMICLIQDHVKRIRSVYNNPDLRIELGDIVNELKTFAAEKDIPVITNTHVNRSATAEIEDAERKGNKDIGKLLGKSNIGESMLMIDNLDCGIFIALDFDKDKRRYMTFNLSKMRGKTTRTYIAQPFMPDSTIRLVDDLGGVPQFKESLHKASEMNTNNLPVKISGASNLAGQENLVDKDSLLGFLKENSKPAQSESYNLSEMDKEDQEIESPIFFFNKKNDNKIAEIKEFFERETKENMEA